MRVVTGTDLISAEQAGQRFLAAMRARQGYCFLRIGDGEGALLQYAQGRSPEADYAYFRKNFGNTLSPDLLEHVAVVLRRTIRGADLLGQRDDIWHADPELLGLTGDEPDFEARIRASVSLRAYERQITGHPLRRFLHVGRSMASEMAAIPACSQWVAYDLAAQGYWESLLAEAGSVGLICPSPRLAAKLEAAGLQVEAHIIPDASAARGQWAHDDGREAVYPDAFDRVVDALNRPLHGKLFLVGGGLVGKGFCLAIKRMGGVALDLGALLDAWDDRATRPAVYHDRFGMEGIGAHIPARLDFIRLAELIAARSRERA